MKKIIVLILVLVLTLGFSSCSAKNNSSEIKETETAELTNNTSVADTTLDSNDTAPDTTAADFESVSEGESATAKAPVLSDNFTSEVLSLTADKKTVKPGDSFIVNIKLHDIENVTSFDFVLDYTALNISEPKVTETKIDEFDSIDNSLKGKYLLSAYTQYSVDISNSNLCTLTFTVNENAVSGSIIEFGAGFKSIKVSENDDGSNAFEIGSLVTEKRVELIVQ